MRSIVKDAKNSSCCSILGKIAKSTVLFLGTAASSYPLAVGIYGCFKPFDLQDPNDLFSSNTTDLQNATLNYANLGHGLEYAVTGCVFAVFTLKSMMGSQSRTVMKELLDEAYDPFITDPSMHLRAICCIEENSKSLHAMIVRSIARRFPFK